MDVNNVRAEQIQRTEPTPRPVPQERPARAAQTQAERPAPAPAPSQEVAAQYVPITGSVYGREVTAQEAMQGVAPQVNVTEVSDEALERAIREANEALALHNVRINHMTHEGTGLIAVTVVDADTEEVIREIPPQSRLDAMYQFRNIEGLFTSLML